MSNIEGIIRVLLPGDNRIVANDTGRNEQIRQNLLSQNVAHALAVLSDSLIAQIHPIFRESKSAGSRIVNSLVVDCIQLVEDSLGEVEVVQRQNEIPSHRDVQ